MNIIKKIKQMIRGNKNTPVISEKYTPSMSMREKEKVIYGEDKINRQRLYEKWSCKDTWGLYKEGIPLLFGLEPGVKPLEEGMEQKIEDLWTHAKECINKRLLSVINKDMPEKEWQVKPADLYCWAMVSRINVPQELSYLMEFVLQTVKSPEIKQQKVVDEDNTKEDTNYLRHRELTLGAAVSLLVNAPESCKNKKDKIKAQLIANQVMTNAELWFENEKPLLAQTAMEDLINQYIKEKEIKT